MAINNGTISSTTTERNIDKLRAASPNGVFTIFGESITAANAAGIHLLGAIDAAQVIGHSIREFLSPDEYEATRQRFEAGVKSGEAAPLIEQTLIRLDGSLIDVEILFVLTGEDDQPLIEAVVRDVSERNRLANALKMIAQLSDAMHAVSDQETVLHTFLDIIYASFGASGAAMIVKDKNGKKYINGYTRGIMTDPSNVEVIFEPARLEEICHSKQISEYNEQSLAGSAPCVLIGVPLVADRNVVSILWLVRTQPLGDFERALLNSIRFQAGTNIQRAVLSDSLKRNLERLQSLRSIDQAINSSLDLALLLNLLLDQVTEQLGVDAACVVLLEDETYLRVRALKGFSTSLAAGVELSLTGTWAGESFTTNTSLKIPDVESRKASNKLNTIIEQEGFVSYFASPLRAKGKSIGVLEVFNRTPLEPESDWFAFLEGIAQQAAIAIDNAAMFNDLRTSKLELENSYELTLLGWMRALELRDEQTEGHTERVTRMCLELGKAYGLWLIARRLGHHAPRRADARHWQNGHSRSHSAQARSIGRSRARLDANPHLVSPKSTGAHPLPAQRNGNSPPSPRTLGRRRLPQ